MNPASVFFSYSRKDSDFVLDLAKNLRNQGVNVWLDQLDIKAGTNWDDSIEEALNKADVLLVVLSEASVNSQNVRDEYSFAIEENKTVIPILYEKCTIPFRLRRLQYADFTSDYDSGFKTLISTLGFKTPATSVEATEIPKLPKKIPGEKESKSVSNSVILKGLGIALIIFAIFYFTSDLILPSAQSTSSQLTVLVHGEAGKDELVLPGRGQVKLIYGDANVIETINSKGEATFKQIPNAFFDDNSQVEILFYDPEGEPYKAVHQDSAYHLSKGQYIPLMVKLYGLDRIHGIVKHFETGHYLDSVRISIQGENTYSNTFGEFELNIPADKQQKFQTIRAFKKGFVPFELESIPIQTDRSIDILLKPEQ